ncbi:LGFP repeat-containing protein [Corynebacterium freiburgense]|uniref:LGFP repeat-containing protein n=1 Tax=Corynebacterium freiburgense TaxID=556548 RepID=UPI0004051442|nr:hypothetical protein [Corynebacterium freiburgense]WJZ01815.1 LGFP repeat protein [Corynebacterium freiburgense]
MNHSKALPLSLIFAVLGVGSLIAANVFLSAPSADHGPTFTYKEVQAVAAAQPTPLDASLPSKEEIEQFTGGMVQQQATKAAHVPLAAHPEPIEKEYQRLGGETGSLGKPLTEIVEAGNHGAKAVYEKGMILWSPRTGAHALYNEFLLKYILLGGEQGILGFPTTRIEKVGTGARQGFEQAAWLYSSQESGVHYVGGRIHEHWQERGGVDGDYGFPKTDIVNVGSDTAGQFDRAVIFGDNKVILSNSRTGVVSEAAFGATE